MNIHIDTTTDYVHRILNGGLGAKPPEKKIDEKRNKPPPWLMEIFGGGEGVLFRVR